MGFNVLLEYGCKSERVAEAPLTLIEVTSDEFLETRITFQSKVLRVGKVIKALKLETINQNLSFFLALVFTDSTPDSVPQLS